jgi:hypothetical protein
MGAVKFDAIAWAFIGDALNHWEEFQESLQLRISDVQSTVATYDDLIRHAQEDQERLMSDLRRAKEERTRNLILADVDSLSAAIAGYQENRDALLPASKEAEHLQREVDNFLAWCSNLKGRYEEATYDEKRVALRMLGVEVRVWKADDPDHERYSIEFKPEIVAKLASLSPKIFLDDDGDGDMNDGSPSSEEAGASSTVSKSPR